MSEASVPPFVYLENAQAPLAFGDPIEVITAHQISDVPAAFAQMQEAQNAGDWLAGYASYELGYALEEKLAGLMPKERDTPLLCFGRFKAPDVLLARSLMHQARMTQAKATLSSFQPTRSREAYASAFETVKAYIGAGDVYQVNLTFPIDAKWSGDPLGLYAALRQRQPVKFGGVVDLGQGPAIVSRSPELFFQNDGNGQISTRPMKGTAPRGSTPQEDEELREMLANDIKNRAENLMIVDLLRNDLSRISDVGSVKVPKLFSVETYKTVHQMTSEIHARLLPKTSISDLFRALFPCGSITGAPKIRAMEIINEVEAQARGAYCGAIGWLASDGTTQFNVAIRTISLFDDGRARLNVGGGIVWDSTETSEYDEAILKSQFARIQTKNSSLPDDLVVLERFRATPKGVLRLDLHLNRALKTCAQFGISVDQNKLRDAIIANLPERDCALRLAITRDGNFSISKHEYRKETHEWVLRVHERRLDSNDPWLEVKTNQREDYDRDRAKLPRGIDEWVYLNEHGEVCEGSITNIFLERGDTLYTPRKEAGLLPGVLREELITSGKVIEATLTEDDLKNADKIYVGNSVRGLIPARFLGVDDAH